MQPRENIDAASRLTTDIARFDGALKRLRSGYDRIDSIADSDRLLVLTSRAFTRLGVPAPTAVRAEDVDAPARAPAKKVRPIASRKYERMRAIAIAMVSAIFGSLVCAPVAAQSLPDRPSVSTIAGNGRLGIADGPAQSASFVDPVAVSIARDGAVYIVDREAERIRMLKNGVVTTVAGGGDLVALGIGAPTGYRDGDAASARFNLPQGIFARDDGSVIVADTGNACLRLIQHGRVSTFAGVAKVTGAADGPLAAARFTSPIGLAADRDGSIYVADPPTGVRILDPHGNVRTMHFLNARSVTSISIPPGQDAVMFAATSEVIYLVDIRKDAILHQFPMGSNHTNVSGRAGRVAGSVSSIVAFSTADFAYTDPLESSVRYGQRSTIAGFDYVRPLNATPSEDAAFGDSAFVDGATGVRFDEPMGIALGANGTLVIADAGNRRIRLAAPFDHKSDITEPEARQIPERADPKTFRVALVGSSYVWFDQPWNESIPGMLERLVNAKRSAGSREIKIYPVMRLGLPNLAALSLIDNELASGNVDMVVWDVTTYGQITKDDGARTIYPVGFEAPLAKALTETERDLGASHVVFVAAVHPGAGDLPDEYAYARFVKGTPDDHPDTADLRDPAVIQDYHDRTAAALKSANVATVDLWPAFLSELQATQRMPLFNTWDHHLTPEGRRIVAAGLVDPIVAADRHP